MLITITFPRQPNWLFHSLSLLLIVLGSAGPGGATIRIGLPGNLPSLLLARLLAAGSQGLLSSTASPSCAMVLALGSMWWLAGPAKSLSNRWGTLDLSVCRMSSQADK